MVMVEIDSSGILVDPKKSRKDAEMLRAYASLMKRLHVANIVPRKHIIDNEVSEMLKTLIREEYNMELELVPPGSHRRNAAELAIQNFKAYFISILVGVVDDSPNDLWDWLIPQAGVTIILLRQSNATPTLSAYAHMSGPFDYNKMPLELLGCQVQFHKNTDKQGTWAFYFLDGWYIATSLKHYHVHKCHIKNTCSERFRNTVQFQNNRTTNPTITHVEKNMCAISKCTKVIQDLGAGKTKQ